MQLAGRTLQYLAGVTGSLCLVTVGINLAWTSPYLSTLVNATTSPIPMSSADASWCAVVPFFGIPLGCLVATYHFDRIGRKLTMLAIAPFVFFSFISIAYAKSLFTLLVSRFIIGSSQGFAFTVLLVYLAEISDPEIRGSVITSMGICLQLGMIFINAIGPLVTIFTSSLMAAAISVLHMITFMWMPKSPYYLIKTGKYTMAKRSLRLLRGRTNVQMELQEIYVAVSRQEASSKGKFSDLFTIRSNRRALKICFIVSLASILSGVNAFTVYTSTIFQTAGAHVNPNLSSVIFNSMGVVGLMVGSRFLDKYGRRFTLLLSTIGCAVPLGAQGFYFFLQAFAPSAIRFLTWLPITAMLSFQIIYTVGLEASGTILMGELFPINVKGKAACLVESVLALGGIYSSQFFHVVNAAFGSYVTFWTFSLCCFVMAIFIYRNVIETSCKTLDEIQLELEE